MGSAMASALSPRPAQPEEWSEAFSLLFQYLDPDQQACRSATAFNLLETGELKPDGIFVLSEDGQVTGVLVCMVIPGASALLWPPQVRPQAPRDPREDVLLQAACAWLRRQGVKLTQVLLHPDDLHLGQSLLRNGFAHVTHLRYLRHDLDLPMSWLVRAPRLDFRSLVEVDRGQFQRVLMNSYEDSLDCPGAQRRTRHRGSDGRPQSPGRHDPDHWWLVLAGAEAIGVAITTVMPETGDWDLSYLGIVPGARRRGFGREIVIHVLLEARAAGVSHVSLCVDGRNEPALQLYEALGFQLFDRREIFLALWPA